MKQICVISGKGGAGKTTITASLTALAQHSVIADCDVDAADMHLLLAPKIKKQEEFFALQIAKKDEEKCIDCGKCYEHCRYGAFDPDNTYHSDHCEGCAVCTIVCPVGALEMVDRASGTVYISDTRFGPMVHAILIPGEEATGKLVARVRQLGREIAEKENLEYIIIDGPPGTGCAVTASLTGVDLVLIVIEPTLSGIHDAKRVLDLVKHFKLSAVACINKYDINEENSVAIEQFLSESGIPLLAKIPYDDVATKAMIEKKTVVEYYDGELTELIGRIWEEITERL